MDSPEYCDLKQIKEENDLITIEEHFLDYNLNVDIEKASIFGDWTVKKDEGNNSELNNADKVIGFDELKDRRLQQCFRCNKLCSDSFNLIKHNLTHIEVSTPRLKPPRLEPQLICTTCNTIFSSKTELLKHYDTHGPNIRKDVLYICKLCKMVTTYRRWHAHVRDTHVLPRFKCWKCGLQFKLYRYLDRHIKIQHEGIIPNWRQGNRPNETNVKLEPSECMECSKKFANKHKLKTHIRNCHTKAVYCKICNSKLKCLTYLYAHMNRVHYDDGNVHDCDVCGKIFKSPRYVNVHKKNAHGVRNKKDVTVELDRGENKKTMTNDSVRKVDIDFIDSDSEESKKVITVDLNRGKNKKYNAKKNESVRTVNFIDPDSEDSKKDVTVDLDREENKKNKTNESVKKVNANFINLDSEDCNEIDSFVKDNSGKFNSNMENCSIARNKVGNVKKEIENVTNFNTEDNEKDFFNVDLVQIHDNIKDSYDDAREDIVRNDFTNSDDEIVNLDSVNIKKNYGVARNKVENVKDVTNVKDLYVTRKKVGNNNTDVIGIREKSNKKNISGVTSDKKVRKVDKSKSSSSKYSGDARDKKVGRVNIQEKNMKYIGRVGEIKREIIDVIDLCDNEETKKNDFVEIKKIGKVKKDDDFVNYNRDNMKKCYGVARDVDRIKIEIIDLME